ncbi:MAG: hypothetical protein U1C73_12740 [Dietzia sp.]|nr:hypothetical protein [Dietzia sp.]
MGRQAEPGDRGHVDHNWARSWSVTAADVVTMPNDNYPHAVAEWARLTLADLGKSCPSVELIDGGLAARSGRLGASRRCGGEMVAVRQFQVTFDCAVPERVRSLLV